MNMPTQLKRRARHLLWIIPLLVADIFIVVWLKGRGERLAAERVARLEPAEPSAVTVLPPWTNLVYPTDQKGLLRADLVGVYQPTASGHPESALFGSVRTANNGSGLLPSFHEGIDIAALRRDRKGRPLDKVYAVAAGRVGYVNRVGGKSNYGKYVVLLHDDPLGEVYTLYAHLAEIEPGLAAGHRVEPGQTLGVMGNTSSSPIPMARAHLHFEIGLMSNARFAEWYRAHRMKPDHGNFNGRNFLGVDPREFLESQRMNPDLDFASHITLIPKALDVVLAAPRAPDFFRRYPALWKGPAPDDGAVVLSCAENGLPLKGRAATDEERRLLGRRKAAVLGVDEGVLGRNGSRIVVRTAKGGWVLGRNGETWREVMVY